MSTQSLTLASLLSLALAVAGLAGCASGPAPAAGTRPHLALVTGSHIPQPVQANGAPKPDPLLRSYSNTQLESTGSLDPAAALALLDPSVRVQH